MRTHGPGRVDLDIYIEGPEASRTLLRSISRRIATTVLHIQRSIDTLRDMVQANIEGTRVR